MLEQLQYYIIPMSACICFLVFIFVGRMTLMRSVSRYFVAGTITILAVILSEMSEVIFASPNYTYVNWQRWLFSIIAYILRPGIACILILIPLRNKQKTTLTTCLVFLPLVVDAFFLLISPFCGIVYTFTDTNHYLGGPLRYLPFVVGAVYLAAFLVILCMEARSNSSMEWGVSIVVVIMCGLSIYLESRCGLLGSLPMACIIGMIFYYVYFFMDYYIKDSLTGAYQRSRFYYDIKRGGFQYFILFDVNGLKHINDEFGHLCGDTALESFGRSVLSILPPKAKFYRIGGDEFAILYPRAKEDDISHLLRRIESKLNTDALPYGISYGFSAFDKAEDFNNAYKSADRMLYENKKSFWENSGMTR